MSEARHVHSPSLLSLQSGNRKNEREGTADCADVQERSDLQSLRESTSARMRINVIHSCR